MFSTKSYPSVFCSLGNTAPVSVVKGAPEASVKGALVVVSLSSGKGAVAFAVAGVRESVSNYRVLVSVSIGRYFVKVLREG